MKQKLLNTKEHIKLYSVKNVERIIKRKLTKEERHNLALYRFCEAEACKNDNADEIKKRKNLTTWRK